MLDLWEANGLVKSTYIISFLRFLYVLLCINLVVITRDQFTFVTVRTFITISWGFDILLQTSTTAMNKRTYIPNTVLLTVQASALVHSNLNYLFPLITCLEVAASLRCHVPSKICNIFLMQFCGICSKTYILSSFWSPLYSILERFNEWLFLACYQIIFHQMNQPR